MAKEASGDVEGAVAGYRALVANYPSEVEAPRALERLLTLQAQYRNAEGEIDYATELAKQATSPELRRVAQRGLPALLVFAKRVEEGLRAYDSLLADSTYDRAGVLFELALIKGLVLSDPDGTREVIRQLQAVSRDYYLLKHARAMLQEVVGPDIWIEVPAPAPATTVVVAEVLTLEQSSPNPMNPRSSIRFGLPRDGRVTLRVFDVQGRLVRMLIDRDLPKGAHVVEWDGRTDGGAVVASGVYHYSIDALGKRLTRKLIVLK